MVLTGKKKEVISRDLKKKVLEREFYVMLLHHMLASVEKSPEDYLKSLKSRFLI